MEIIDWTKIILTFLTIFAGVKFIMKCKKTNKQVQISGDKCINTQLISGDIAIDGASIDDK